MAIHERIKPFVITDGRRFRLKDHDPADRGWIRSKDDAKDHLKKDVEKIGELQETLYAQDEWGMLLIFQAMDAAGKDSVIKHVMSGINPQGCQVSSFKAPSAEELDHDFLWRTTAALPERGRIGIFNRSYYEEVLIVRVHPEILEGQGLPRESLNDKHFWKHRYRSIVDLEKHLHRNGTRVVKFFLHLSKEEQRKRFLARLDDPSKNWKFSRDDVEERRFWKDYQNAYEACLSATSTDDAPWYVVPADDKKNARLILSEIILHVLGDLDLSYPKPTLSKKELLAIRRKLAK